jgi:hypothetical protein
MLIGFGNATGYETACPRVHKTESASDRQLQTAIGSQILHRRSTKYALHESWMACLVIGLSSTVSACEWHGNTSGVDLPTPASR